METDLPPIANFISNILLIMLLITFVYALFIRFVSDETLFDRILLPSNDPRKLTYYIEPCQNYNDTTIFPTIFDYSELTLSIVIPAKNEEIRISTTLNDCISFLHYKQSLTSTFTWEIIVVDDYSSDRTTDTVLSIAKEHPEVRLLRQPQKMGYGKAVQAGCSHCRGKLILIVDPDNSTKIEEYNELENQIRELSKINSEAIVIGSRTHLFSKRSDLSKYFLLFPFLGIKGIQDGLSSFKLITKSAARWIFPNQHVTGPASKAEIILIAKARGMAISEFPVEWMETDTPSEGILTRLQNFCEFVEIALFYRLGLWTIRQKSHIHNDSEI